MKTLRMVLWAMVVIFAGVSGYAWLTIGNEPKVIGQNENAVKIGGPFELVSHKGTPITDKDLTGKSHAIFFGFTNCPDICPTTLLETAGWIKELGGDADNIGFYFFTVDPEHDTPEVLADYVNAFDPRITGVTGNAEEMTKTIKSYRAYAKRVELEDGDYTMDHSAFVMLFTPDGDFKGTISYGESNEIAVEKLRRLIKNS